MWEMIEGRTEDREESAFDDCEEKGPIKE